MPQDVPKNFSKDNEWTTTKWNYRSLFHLYEASVERFPTLEIYMLYILIHTAYILIHIALYQNLFMLCYVLQS